MLRPGRLPVRLPGTLNGSFTGSFTGWFIGHFRQSVKDFAAIARNSVAVGHRVADRW